MGSGRTPQPCHWHLGCAAPASPLEQQLVASALGRSPELPRPAHLRAQRTSAAALRAELPQCNGQQRAGQWPASGQCLRVGAAGAQPQCRAVGCVVYSDGAGLAQPTHGLPDRSQPHSCAQRVLVVAQPAALAAPRQRLELVASGGGGASRGVCHAANGTGVSLVSLAAPCVRSPTGLQ